MTTRVLLWCLPTLLVAAAALGQPVTFRHATTQALATEPTAMAVGDLNNDQHPDVVVANFADGTVSVFLAQTDGSLANAADFPAGGVGKGILIGDIDGDTIPDVLVSEEESDNLHLLHGFGDGTLGDPTTINSGHDPVQIVAADLDGDQVVDLAVTLSAAGEGGGRVSILHGLGGGIFDEPQIISLEVGTEGIVADDFDGDEKIDLAAANSSPGTISVLHNLGDLNFASPVSLAAGNGAGPLILGDVDGDGRSDLIAANTGDSTIAVLRSRGDGTFDPAVTFPCGGTLPSALAVADVNGDTHLDVLVSQELSQSVSVLLGVGDGSFDLPRTFVADIGPISVATLDLNNDTKLDGLTANAGGGGTPSLAFLFGDGTGSLDGIEQLSADSGAAGVVVADFNEDAVADAAVVQPAAHGVSLILGDGLPTGTVTVDGVISALATADLDGDDHFDLAMATGIPDVSIVFGHGDGSFTSPSHVPLPIAPAALAVGDFDQDGAFDLVATLAGASFQLIVMHNNRDRSFSALPALSLGARPLSLVVGDFNGDGKADVAVGDGTSVLIFAGQADSMFAQPRVVATGVPALALAASDVDADGDTDLIIAISSQGQGGIRVLTNDGQGGFTVGPLRTAGELTTALAVRDFDGDGIPELLAADRIENTVGLLTNNGRGAFQLSFKVLASVRPNSIATGDFNDDGIYDVVAAGETVCRLTGADAVATLRGDGNGDGLVSAADLVALARELGDGDGTRVDDVPRGTYPGHPGVDADGDGAITRVDARATILRLMHRRDVPIAVP